MLSRPHFLLLTLLALPACGLLVGEPELPDGAAVRAAREADQAEWQWLAEAYVRSQQAEDPEVGLAVARSLAARHPQSLRLAFFAQDLALEVEGREPVVAAADAALAEAPTVANLLLRARLERDRDQRYELVRQALALEHDVSLARVMRLALEARAGEPEILNRLIRLLQDDPGCAEGWRLLGELAPLYDRADLARAAALTEPWSPVADPEEAFYALAVAELRAGNPARTLELAEHLREGAQRTLLLQASAYAAMDQADTALTLVDAVLAQDPQDATAVFDRALLLRDYLGRHREARLELERFLALVEEGAEVPLTRRMQAELWLAQTPTP